MARNKYIIRYDAGTTYVSAIVGHTFEFNEEINKAIKFNTSGEAAKAIENTRPAYGPKIAYQLSIREIYTVSKPLKRSEFRKHGTRILRDFIK